MLINKINKLNNIFNFIDFDSSEHKISSILIKGEEKNIKNTLIYAPNGSGKTNFSRFFDFISNQEEDLSKILSKEAGNDIGELSFSLELNNENINESNYISNQNIKNIYVFNNDFIEKNIKASNFSKKIEGKIVVPIGETSSIINSLENENKDLFSKKDNLLKKINSNFSNKKEELEKKYEKKEQSIWNNFNLLNIIDSKGDKINIVENDEENFIDCETKIEKIKSFKDEDKINYNIQKILESEIELINKSITLLKEPKNFQGFEDKKVEDKIKYITQKWLNDNDFIKSGITESENAGSCLLCGRKLNEEVNQLFNDYKKYFSQEKSKYENDINNKINEINALIRNIKNINNNHQQQINEVIKILDINENYKSLDNSEIIDKLTIIKSKLEQKIKNSSKVIDIDKKAIEEIEKLNINIDNNSKIVKKINNNIDNNKERKTELRKIIGKKYLYNFYIDNVSYFDNIESINKDINDNNKKIDKEKESLPKNDLISNIISLMNIFLQKYLGLEKYEVSNDNGLIILNLKCSESYYNISDETNKISEGEKVMVAISYYLASSIEKGYSIDNFNKLIFIIDDPVSSISYGNFFGLSNLIRNFDKVINKKIFDSENNSGNQKIILTHNTQFFNMLVNNVFKKKGLYFLLNHKKIEKIKDERLMSEFKTSIYRIYKYNEGESIYGNPGNDLRRFFETVRHFYGLKGAFEADTLTKIFNDFEEDKHKEFYDASNYYSHSNPEIDVESIGSENINSVICQFVELIEKSVFSDLWEEIKSLE